MRFQTFAYPLIILVMVIAFVGAIKWQNEAVNEAEMRLLDMQVNYAVDAAVQEMLEQADWGRMQLDPEVARKTYVKVLLRNIGWSDTEENFEALEQNCIPFFCVAVYDGYYMWTKQDTYTDIATSANGHNVVTRNKSRDLMWSPKLPYSYQYYDKNASMNSATLYYYNIGDKTYGTYKNGRLKVDNILSKVGTGNGSLNMARKVIADNISTSCTSALLYATEGQSNQEVDIPFLKSSWMDANPITTPTVLTVINSPDGIFTKYDHFIYGVGGAKVDEALFCICYRKSGIKLYTYAYNRDKVTAEGITVDEVVTSPKAACDRGYYFDLTY